jgi:2-polyprenyl-3-methyl-5-hydroxy-6-metoxy-1,4-benzoquinol methylase
MSKKCFLCNKTNYKTELVINSPDRFELALGISSKNYSRIWKKCLGCSLYYNLNSKENQKLVNSIGDKYYEFDFPNINLVDRFNKIISLPNEKSDNYKRVQRIKTFINKYLSLKNEKINTLDIGSGLGIFMHALIDQNWSGTAIEPDPIAYKVLKQISNKRFRTIQSLYHTNLIEEKFNLITFNKVLEHIENPINLLQQVKSNLASDGLIYVEVPDSKTVKTHPHDDNILGSLHMNLYNVKSLSLLFKKSGLVPVKVNQIIEPSGKITTYGFAKKLIQ